MQPVHAGSFREGLDELAEVVRSHLPFFSGEDVVLVAVDAPMVDVVLE